jgi:hypothetical protein
VELNHSSRLTNDAKTNVASLPRGVPAAIDLHGCDPANEASNRCVSAAFSCRAFEPAVAAHGAVAQFGGAALVQVPQQ